MCLPIAVREPERVLAHGNHKNHEWMVVHNNRGYRCGYVKVPPGHPWHGKGYDDVECEVHGGLTFAKKDEPCGNGDDDGWWLGFDCAHGWDAPDPALPGSDETGFLGYRGEVRTQEYVEEQCRSLCEQAAAA